MAADQTNVATEVRYTRELGPRQVVSLGLRSSLPVLAFLALGPLTARSGIGAPVALLLGALLWLPSMLSYLELASQCPEGGIYEAVAKHRAGLLPFLAGWATLLASIAANALLAREAAVLAEPWLAQLFSLASSDSLRLVVAGLVLVLAPVMAALRRRPWRSLDDLVLLGGLIAVLLTIASAFLLQARPPSPPDNLARIDFEHILSGALIPVLMLLAVEAIGEWKADVRRPINRLPRWTLISLAILIAGTMLLLLAGMRLDSQTLAQLGLAGVLSQPPSTAWIQLARILFFVAIMGATSSLILQANRLLGQLTRDGYLPRLRLTDRRHRIIVGLTTITGLSVLVLLLPENLGFVTLLGTLLLMAVTVNLSDILFRPSKEDIAASAKGTISQLFLLPFYPLIPGLGILITIFLAIIGERGAALSMFVTLTAAVLVYGVYGRTTHRTTLDTKISFRRRQPASPDGKKRFRVLVPFLGNPAEQRELLRVASALASREDGEVLALQVITLPPQFTRAEGSRLAREHNQLMQWSLAQIDSRVPINSMTRVGRDPGQTIVETVREEGVDLLLLPWHPEDLQDATTFARSTATQRRRLTSELVRGAPCVVAALDGPLPDRVGRIMVPTAGGPHAPVAARLAVDLAQEWQAEVVGLNIIRDETDDRAMGIARDLVLGTFQGLEGAEEIEIQLIPSQKAIAETLVEEADQNFDLVMLGASNEGLLDRVLFGDIPEQIAEQTDTPAIMVRAAQPAQEAMVRLLWERIQNVLPTLDGEEQIELYRGLRRGARPSVNFFVLIVLSALIATLGLWQNSAAVIIGAMLVAPLMTPILATSLGIVMGDGRLIRLSLEATIKGVVSGIAIALFVSLLLPELRVGSEILARTQPTVLDLVIALASGAAGAYALARREVSAALPGVAIAAALMPPLCTVGIGLASFSGLVTGGAMLLFVTNLIAITVAGGLVFLLLGMRPRRGEQERAAQFRRGLAITLILLVLVSIPLTWLGVRSTEQIRNQTIVSGWLDRAANSYGAARLLEARVQRDGKILQVYARVEAGSEDIEQAVVDAWSDHLAEETGRTVNLVVSVQPVVQLESRSR